MESRKYNFEFAASQDHQALEKLITRAEQRYTEVGSTLARHFITYFHQARRPIKGLLRQQDIFEQRVKPHLGQGKVAYVWFPTIDHMVPVACGGGDDDSNWVCTSMRSNQIKAHWRLEDLGWTLYPPGDPVQWDGLLAWFRQASAAGGTAFPAAALGAGVVIPSCLPARLF